MVLFPPPFYFVFDISNLLSYIKIISSYELARPVMGTIFLVQQVTGPISYQIRLEDGRVVRCHVDNVRLRSAIVTNEASENEWKMIKSHGNNLRRVHNMTRRIA